MYLLVTLLYTSATSFPENSLLCLCLFVIFAVNLPITFNMLCLCKAMCRWSSLLWCNDHPWRRHPTNAARWYNLLVLPDFLTPFYCRGHERVQLYLYSIYGPYGLYRASVPVHGCTLPLPLLTDLLPPLCPPILGYEFIHIPLPSTRTTCKGMCRLHRTVGYNSVNSLS
jgi:hypothetical protein